MRKAAVKPSERTRGGRHRIGRKTNPALWIEPPYRLHQADISLGDDVCDGQAIASIAHGDLCNETKVAGDEAIGRIAIAVLTPASCEVGFFFLR